MNTAPMPVAPIVARQVEMDFLLAHCYPLITGEEAAFLLDCDKTTITHLTEDGTLPAVNIALDEGTRQQPRLWRWAVLHVCLRPETPMDQIPVADTLPHRRDLWLIHETAALLRCSEDHIHNLLSEKLLAGPDRNAARPGTLRPRVRIWRKSIVNLIETRTVSLS